MFIHLVATVAKLFGSGGARTIVAESFLVKHQLLILNRSRERAQNLRSWDRIIVGLCAMLMRPGRVLRSAIVLKPSTIFGFHRALVKRKYRLLFTPKTRSKPGPKARGPSRELIEAIAAMKQRNPNWRCPKIAQQISLVFGIDIDKAVVRRVLARHYRPAPHGNGPSWLTFLGHMKDGLWSIDLFRCESAILQTYWVLLVMDQYTPYGRFRCSHRNRRRCRAVSNVQPRHPRPNRPRKTSAPTTIRCTFSTAGAPISVYWISPKLKPALTCHYHIPLSNGSSPRVGASRQHAFLERTRSRAQAH